jgi:hypothetical protein
MYQGVERRRSTRHHSPRAGVILLEQDSITACTVRDFSPVGAGLLMPEYIDIPHEFYLTFGHVTHHSVTVWRQRDRMGVKFKPIFDSRRDKALWVAIALVCGQ